MLRDIDTADDWIAEINRYTDLAQTAPTKELRLVRACLDGAFCRLSREHRPQMLVALEQANQRLPQQHQLGFWDSHTGETFGLRRPTTPLGPSSV